MKTTRDLRITYHTDNVLVFLQNSIYENGTQIKVEWIAYAYDTISRELLNKASNALYILVDSESYLKVSNDIHSDWKVTLQENGISVALLGHDDYSSRYNYTHTAYFDSKIIK